MDILSLNGSWQLQAEGKQIAATVPGSVYSDLLQAGEIPDPYSWKGSSTRKRT